MHSALQILLWLGCPLIAVTIPVGAIVLGKAAGSAHPRTRRRARVAAWLLLWCALNVSLLVAWGVALRGIPDIITALAVALFLAQPIVAGFAWRVSEKRG